MPEPWHPWLEAFTAVCRDLVEAVADQRNTAGSIAPYVSNVERIAACQPQLPEHMTRITTPSIGTPAPLPPDQIRAWRAAAGCGINEFDGGAR